MDICLLNAMLGISAHGGCHACAFCDGIPALRSGTLRTFTHIAEKLRQYREAGADPSQMKDYAHVAKECLIKAGASEEVFGVVPLPELHLLIGVVNYLLKLLITCFLGVLEVLKAHSIFRHGYNGGGLDGSSCKKLLQKLENMRSAVPVDLQPVLYTLDTFSLVVDGCFSRKLINNYESQINHLRSLET